MAAISHISEDHCKTSKDHGNREIEVDGVKKLCANTEHRHNKITQTYIHTKHEINKNKSSRKKKKGKNSRIGERERERTYREDACTVPVMLARSHRCSVQASKDCEKKKQNQWDEDDKDDDGSIDSLQQSSTKEDRAAKSIRRRRR